MLRRFGENIWIADGPEVTAAAGFHYPTRMALIRLESGGLFVWSPVPLSEALRAEIDALGPVRHIVAPNTLHHLFVAGWAAAYPEARLHAAPGLAAKRGDLAFDSELGNSPDPGWQGEIDQLLMRNAIATEAVFFHIASGTVLITDLLQQLPPGWFTGWRALVARLDGMTGPEPAVPRKFRLGFTRRNAARAAVQKLLAWPAAGVVMAHGKPVRADAPAFLARAFRWLTG